MGLGGSKRATAGPSDGLKATMAASGLPAAAAEWFGSRLSPAMAAVAAKGCSGGAAAPPAMACGVLRCAADGCASFEHGCSGLRQVGGVGGECELHDRWHLGSNTKAFTAALAAISVERGEVDWGTTIDDALSDLAIHSGYSGVTLLELLSNSSGAPGTAPPACWQLAWEREEARHAPAAQRRSFVEALLALAPESERGAYSYSNQGFAIAGHMLETVAGTGYEELLTARLLQPLGITTAGFGAAPGTASPWGHAAEGPARVAADPTVLGSDNPTAIAPAGRLHMSLPDWARFVSAFVTPQVAAAKLGLGREVWAKLHAPVVAMSGADADYGLGWLVCERPWADGPVATHSGSNTMNYATVWAVPAVGDGSKPLGSMAVLVACNAGGDGAQAAVSDACSEIIRSEVAALKKS
jgi:D-alanyl-D-alanine carboxypeptidase